MPKISDLPELTQLSPSTYLPIVQDGTTYKMTIGGTRSELFIDPHMFGAKGDAVSLPNATIAGDFITITHTQYSFQSRDVGKTVWMSGGWQDDGETSVIQSVSAGAAVVDPPFTRTGSRYILFGTDDTNAIQAAFDAAETIMLSTIPTTNIGTGNGMPTGGTVVLRNGGYIVKNTQERVDAGKPGAICVPRRCSLLGQSPGSTGIYAAPGNVGHVITNKGSATFQADEKLTIGNFSIYGLRDIQGSNCGNAIHIATGMSGYSQTDAYSQLFNINIHGSRKTGVYLKGRGEFFVKNVCVNYACEYGFDLQVCQDFQFTDCNAGGCYYAGFHVWDAPSSRFNNCKSFYNGSNGENDPEKTCNWYIGNASGSNGYTKGCCIYNGCESQESRGSGWVIAGGLNQFTGCLQQDHKRSIGPGSNYPTIRAGIHFFGNSSNNVFNGFFIRAGVGLDYSGSTENHNGGDYAVYIEDNLNANAIRRAPRGNKGYIYTLEPMNYTVSKIGGAGATNTLNTKLFIDGVALT